MFELIILQESLKIMESSEGIWPITMKLLVIINKSHHTLNIKKAMFQLIFLQESLKIMRK